MAAMLYATPGQDFVGHQSIFQFENKDGTDAATACGQCAIATVLANRRRIPKSIAGLRLVEKEYSADVASGAWGTSAGRVERALSGFGLRYRYAEGQKELREALRKKAAAIALIQNTAGLGGMGDGAHWFVVFGCDSKGVHVTNYTPLFIAWPRFEEMWSGPIPTMAVMGGRAICC